ncbi:HIT-like domain-containing protein [Mycena rosella]|uniref:HIT-like domain-containing protein n=1 Tax=Mycena rosella TaxID=1033263 RepID=A0AAD7H1U9_MYCRO|nr:HIT-like domain-containing protein [Mycena rosella]
MSAFNLTILRTYAQTNPSKLPPSVLFSHSATSLTVYDAFPKAIFHFLVLPRAPEPSAGAGSELANLRQLLSGDKARAQQVLASLRADAHALRAEIEEEMLARYGFKWGIWTGFHGAPSMDHLHLHVLSDDLCSDRMKNKKHYNSFHPKLGFFLDIDEVLSWFDADPSYYSTMAKLDAKHYELMLKEDLSCWRCNAHMKNIPTLKTHLQEEWDAEAKREKAKIERRRKMEEKSAQVAENS